MSLASAMNMTGLDAAKPTSDFIAGRIYIATDTKILYYDTGSALTAYTLGGNGLYSAYLCYQDQKTNGTHGGTATSGSFADRILNTVVADTASIGSLSGNHVTLPAGTYRVQASAPVYSVDSHKMQLFNVTDTTTVIIGTNAHAAQAALVGGLATLAGRFTIAGSKALALQHRVQTTQATNGFGPANSFSTIEVYATIEFWKE